MPTAVVANSYVPPELEIRFDMVPPVPDLNNPNAPLPLNWCLRFIHNQLFNYFQFPSRFCPGKCERLLYYGNIFTCFLYLIAPVTFLHVTNMLFTDPFHSTIVRKADFRSKPVSYGPTTLRLRVLNYIFFFTRTRFILYAVLLLLFLA